jgi:hypothetical protein
MLDKLKPCWILAKRIARRLLVILNSVAEHQRYFWRNLSDRSLAFLQRSFDKPVYQRQFGESLGAVIVLMKSGRAYLQFSNSSYLCFSLRLVFLSEAIGEKTVCKWRLPTSASNNGTSVELIASDVDELAIRVTLGVASTEESAFVSVQLLAVQDSQVRDVSLVLDSVHILSLFDWIGRRRTRLGESVALGNGAVVFGSQTSDQVSLTIERGEGLEVFKNARVKVTLESGDYHPSLSFPFRLDGKSIPNFDSVLTLNEGQSREYRVRFDRFLPQYAFRPWLHRDGFEATYIWTEHACHTAIPMHKAAYFGRSDVDHPSLSSGGFCHYSIPVTKSIHWTNRKLVTNAGQSSSCPGLMTSVDDAEFQKFLKKLTTSANYIELCLHCADPAGSTTNQTSRSLAEFTANLSPTATWIDHIWLKPDGNVSGCPEAFVCEGATNGSQWFHASVWQEYGIRFFWTPVYEYSRRFFSRVLPQSNGEPFYRFVSDIEDCGLIHQWYWRSRSAIQGAWEWSTLSAEQVGGSADDWRSAYSEEALNAFVERNGIYINHAYPAYAGDTSAYVTRDGKEFVISAGFDAALANLARFRDQHKVRLESIKGFFEHVEKLEQVRFMKSSGHCCILRNEGSEPIDGFTIAIYGNGNLRATESGKIALKRIRNAWLASVNLEADTTFILSIDDQGVIALRGLEANEL